MAEQKTILVLGCASRTAHGRDQMTRLSAQARRRNLRIVGADTAANLESSPGLIASGVVDSAIALEVESPDACREWAKRSAPRISAVVTFREMCVESASAVGDALGLPCIAPDVAHRLRNKNECREALRRAGFRQPVVLRTSDIEEARHFVSQGSGPWIVKPPDGMGSQGISKLSGPEGLVEAVDLLGHDADFLVEAFVDGSEYSAEGVILRGSPVVLALTEKQVGAGFVETSHRQPANLRESEAATAVDEIANALRALNVTHGIFHVEFWMTSDGVVLGEVHARPGGDFIHAMVEYIRPGLELYGMALDDLLGHGVEESLIPGPSRAAGVEYLALPAGRVESVDGWESLASEQSVLASQLAIQPGDNLEPATSSGDRHGFVVVGAASREDVDAEIRRLLSKNPIRVTPGTAQDERISG